MGFLPEVNVEQMGAKMRPGQLHNRRRGWKAQPDWKWTSHWDVSTDQATHPCCDVSNLQQKGQNHPGHSCSGAAGESREAGGTGSGDHKSPLGHGKYYP